MLSEVFADILRHTHGLGFIDMIKIVSNDKETLIEAMDENKTVVFHGKLKTPLEDIQGTVGLSRMAVLQGYLKFPSFMADDADIEIITQKRGEEDVPSEILFTSPDKHTASYRFMHKDIAEEQIKVPPFKGVEWDVVVTPTEANLKDLSYFNGVLGTFEPIFTAKVEDKNLNLHIGSGPTDRAVVPFTKNVDGELTGNRSNWPLIQTLAILKLADKAGDCTMSFSSKGALKIEMTTPIGEYEYILPAKIG